MVLFCIPREYDHPMSKVGVAKGRKGSASSAKKSGAKAKPKRSRMGAEERRESILAAARKTFAEKGDSGATTTKMIAEEAGISEAIIYRHFDSKDELFAEAVLQPLREATSRFAATVGELPSIMTEEERMLHVERMFKSLIGVLNELSPLLGLVLFGDPEMARDFYLEHWKPFLEELGKDWTEFYKRAGVKKHPDSATAARIVAGAALLAALDRRFDSGSKKQAAVPRQFTEMMFDGVFLRVE
jgi:AcrR family transcriptional regulator